MQYAVVALLDGTLNTTVVGPFRSAEKAGRVANELERSSDEALRGREVLHQPLFQVVRIEKRDEVKAQIERKFDLEGGALHA